MGSTEHLHSPSAHGEEIHHETTDVNLTGVTRLAIGSLLVIVGILLFVVAFEKLLAHFLVDTSRTLPTLADRNPGQDRIPKSPVVILTDEPGALRQLRTEEEQILNHYAWVDKNQGIVRIPISKAIELVAKNPALLAPQGAPAAAPPPPGPTVPAATAPAPAAPSASTPPKGRQ